MEQENNLEKKLHDEEQELLQEKCWVEEYKGASRKWLIRDASATLPPSSVCSTMKESYIYCDKLESKKNMGKRKEALLRKFQEEAMSEIIKEREARNEINDYCTEYEGCFNGDGFKLDNQFHKRMTELYQKYPLYSSTPMSIYQFAVNQTETNNFPGVTKLSRTSNAFCKNATFTKPLGEKLNDIEY